MNRIARAWAATRRPVRSEVLALLAALFFAVICNGAFWRSFSAAGGWNGAGAWRLAPALFVGTLALHTAFLLLGVLPSLLVWRVQPVQRSLARGVLAHGVAFVLAVGVAVAAIGLAYQPLASFMRNEKAIRHLIAPGNWIVALATVALDE